MKEINVRQFRIELRKIVRTAGLPSAAYTADQLEGGLMLMLGYQRSGNMTYAPVDKILDASATPNQSDGGE